jgi:hypothetical protein
MKVIFLIQLIFSSAFFCCKGQNDSYKIVQTSGTTVLERFNPPNGFERISVNNNSFGAFLRNLKLKPFGSSVLYYNNTPKPNNNIYISVIAMDIDKQDLQQCADAIMRLKGEYLYKEKLYQEIHFNLLSDEKPRYFLDYSKGDTSYTIFRKYLRFIFANANTTSLYDELVPVDNIKNIKIGDIFIQKKKPYGHAIIVIDIAEDKKSGKKVYLLAQSYMPAQETQILVNPFDSSITPWYELNNDPIYTPQWTFYLKDLRRFKE